MNAAAPIRTGVIGVGHLGRFHVEKHAALPQVELVGVFDLDGDRAREVAARHGTRAWASMDELLAAVEAVSIAVPTVDHFAVASRALEAGVHVLLEKPIAATIEEGQQLVSLAVDRGLILQIGHLERFNPVFMAASEKLGQPWFIEVHRLSPFTFRSTDVDVILDLMIHDLDLVLSLVQSPIEEIFAVGVPVLSQQVDIANVRIHFAGGPVCNLTASRVSLQKERKIRLFLPDAYFSLDLANFSLVRCERREFDYSSPIPQLDYQQEKFPEADSLMNEIESFVTAVREGRPPVISGADALVAMEAAFQIKAKIDQLLTRLP
ncbi:MAG: Gfo/Idh/MocA family oxidoreductase [Deltaproteobacteria bacterium]|nr:Gfo/Idh/MocA family oxidoreductase [Deltaproteobacteria bacterium]